MNAKNKKDNNAERLANILLKDCMGWIIITMTNQALGYY